MSINFKIFINPLLNFLTAFFILSVNTINAQWEEVAKTLPEATGGYQYFGQSVAIYGDYAVVGAFRENNTQGAVYVYYYDGHQWNRQSRLTASDGIPDAQFGNSVSISGETIVVGACCDDEKGNKSGSAYIFTRNGTTWSQQAKLTASDGDSFDYFGISVKISGETVVIGAYGDEDNGLWSGSVYIFQRNGNQWNEQAKLIPSDGKKGDQFGGAVSISDETVAIGAFSDDMNGKESGSVYVFSRSGIIWNQKAKIIASDGHDNAEFGRSVSISDKTIVIGAPHNIGNGSNNGSAYIFTLNNNIWEEKTKLTTLDGDEYDEFGHAISISNNTIVVGAYYADDNGPYSGSAYIFVRNGEQWIKQTKLTASDGSEFDQFGCAVGISENTIIVGAYYDESNSKDAGSAYLFSNSSNSDKETIGYTSTLASSGAVTNRRAVPVTMTEDGAIESISIYHQGSSDGSQLLLGVYDDNAGLPGNLLGVTPATVINSNEGWQTVDLQSPVNAASGETVWLAFVFENCPGIRFQAGTPGRASSFDTWAGGMPASFGTSSQADYIYSIYATYSDEMVPEEKNVGYTMAFDAVGAVTNRRAVPVTMTEDGAIESISIYHQGGSDGSEFLLGVYADNAGLPGNLLGVTPATVINSSEGWQTVDLQSPVNAASGETVWLAFVFENCPGIRYQAGTPGRASSYDTWASGIPADFGASTQADYIYSIYASYSDEMAPDEKTVGYTMAFDGVGAVTNRRAVPVTMTEDGAIESISIYHQGAGDGSELLLGVYADDAGLPGNLLGVTPATVINSSEGWQTVELQSPVNAASGETLWLAFVFENCPGIRFQAGTPGRASSYDTWSGGMPAGFGAATQADYIYSIYATYSESLGKKQVGHTIAFDGVGAVTNRRAMPVTMSEDGTIESISIYHQGSSDGSQLLLGVYADNAGLPGNLLGVTPATVINSLEGWQTVALETPANALEGETVWLAFVFENCPGIRYQAGTPGRASSFETWAEGMPANFGASSQADYIYSIYATYGEPSAERTAGYTSAFSGIGPVTNRRAMPVTMSEDGAIESISIYHQGSNDGSQILLGIYADDAGLPGSSLGVTPATVINSNEGWQTVDLISPVNATSGQTLWLAFVFENCPGIRFQAGTPGRASSIETWAEAMPANFGTSSQADYIYSVYCSYLLANNASNKTNSNDNTLTEKVGSTLTGINDNKFADKTLVTIFPNPTSGELNITLDKVFDKELKITFYNTLGSVVKVLDIAPQNSNISINLSELKQGIYTVIITDENAHSIIHRANVVKK